MAKAVDESVDRETRYRGPYRISYILPDVGKALVEALEGNVEVGDSGNDEVQLHATSSRFAVVLLGEKIERRRELDDSSTHGGWVKGWANSHLPDPNIYHIGDNVTGVYPEST